jgi:hypothetical protein
MVKSRSTEAARQTSGLTPKIGRGGPTAGCASAVIQENVFFDVWTFWVKPKKLESNANIFFKKLAIAPIWARACINFRYSQAVTLSLANIGPREQTPINQ